MSWLKPILFLIPTAVFAGGLAVAHVSPLTTHALHVPLNSTATAAPVTLAGITGLPALLWGHAGQQRWAILGGSLLQLGLSESSVPVLTRAVAADPDNLTLRSALGEALVLSNDGQVTPEAKSQFDVVLVADPNDLIARFYSARWLLQHGKPKPALVKLVGLMRTVGNDRLWYDRLWEIMPQAADQVGVSPLALRALCVAGM
jgi:predicted Zn-dependent protease